MNYISKANIIKNNNMMSSKRKFEEVEEYKLPKLTKKEREQTHLHWFGKIDDRKG